MMPILVKSDDVRSGRKAKAHHGQPVTAGMGVNGLKLQISDDIPQVTVSSLEH